MSAAPAGAGAVRGVGIDVVDVARFGALLDRRPSVARRLFTDAERTRVSGRGRSSASLAARFAAKEATMKALGVGLGAFALHDVEVVTTASGRPDLTLAGRAAELAAEQGISRWQLSLAHDGGVATAVVVAQ